MDGASSTADRKKMLALDGGGIRGVLSLGILAALEKIVGQKLGDYFDYIGGTSTGAIIAAGLAEGMSVYDLTKFYIDAGPAMFEERSLLRRYKSLYSADPLKDMLERTFGSVTRLGSSRKPLLLVVTRNWTTDSPWPLSSNPAAKYNDRSRKDCNLEIPLWQLVRASTAAPVYFPPEVLSWDPNDPTKTFVFQDGGVTPYNNPAFLMYRMATVPEYKLGWEQGEDKLLLISVGTGSAPKTGATIDSPEQNLLAQARGVISALMYACEVDQDVNCRVFGRCVYGGRIDSEIGSLIAAGDSNSKKAFRYARYNPEMTAKGLTDLGVQNFDLENLLRMDLATHKNIDKLLEVGHAMGRRVSAEHLGSFL